MLEPDLGIRDDNELACHDVAKVLRRGNPHDVQLFGREFVKFHLPPAIWSAMVRSICGMSTCCTSPASSCTLKPSPRSPPSTRTSTPRAPDSSRTIVARASYFPGPFARMFIHPPTAQKSTHIRLRRTRSQCLRLVKHASRQRLFAGFHEREDRRVNPEHLSKRRLRNLRCLPHAPNVCSTTWRRGFVNRLRRSSSTARPRPPCSSSVSCQARTAEHRRRFVLVQHHARRLQNAQLLLAVEGVEYFS